MEMGGMEVKFSEKGEWRLPDLSHTDDLVLCSELEEGLRVMIGHFVE